MVLSPVSTYFLIILPILGGITGFVINSIRDDKNDYESSQKESHIEELNNRIYKENKEVELYNYRRRIYWQEVYYHNEQQKQIEEKKNEIRFIRIKTVQINSTSKEIDLIDSELETISNALKTMFSLKINDKFCLHQAYRSLSAIAIIYGYIDTGRCSELEGYEGAYNLYEQEKRLGYIIDSLDLINNKLNQLNGTMIYLGQAIIQCNEKLEQLNENSLKTLQAIEDMNLDIVESMGSLSKDINSISNDLSGISNSISNIEINSANSAYYAEVGSEAATFSAYYDLFKN